MLRCSEWWVKEQARKRRIPYSWIGGSYLFTDEHVAEIMRRFEVQPTSRVAAVEPASVPIGQMTGHRTDQEESAVRLTAKRPRRVRNAGAGTARAAA
jgi:hypothetical protein